jgi:hypothetical protein
MMSMRRFPLEVINREEKNTHPEEITHTAKTEPRARFSTRAKRSESVMSSAVRIVKRGRVESLQAGDERKAERTCERRIASTVRSWIAEREEQRRLSERKNWDMLIKFAQ